MSSVRDRSGMGLRMKVGPSNISLSESGRALLRTISNAGNRRDWQKVQQLVST